MQKQAVTTKARFTCHWNSWAGAVHGVLTAAGMYEGDMSRLMGITGTLFHVIMHEECCVSSATVYDWPVEHKFGLDRLGVLTEQYNAMTDETTYEAARRRAVTNIKAAVDRGVGVVLWGVDSGEFGVVYGYDDADGVLLVDGYFGMNGGSNPILYENVGRSFEGAPFLDYLIPVEKVAFDPAKSYRGSLEYYVRHMEAARHVAPAYKSGLLAYDNWLRALEQGKYQAHGLRYNPTVYAENKREAVAYLKFLAAEWNPRLAPAVPVFERIHEVYSRMMTVLGHQMPDSVPLFAAVEPEQAAGLIPLVKEARDLEVEALAIVKAALA